MIITTLLRVIWGCVPKEAGRSCAEALTAVEFLEAS